MSKRWTAADIERLRTRKAKPAPPDVVGHPAAREATHSSTTPDEIQAYHSQSDDALRAFRAGLDAAREGRGPKEVNLR